MKDRFFLYIDILGFSELIKNEQRTRELYEIIDSLNVHDHDMFQTIVFSDTILVYNKKIPADREAAEYIVWYSTEFAEDLHFSLIGKDLYFRGMLTYGAFEHYHLKNIEYFFGQALVNAYNSEKDAPTTGLLIDNECQKHLKFFESEPFDDNWHFVYLERAFKQLHEMAFGKFPIPVEVYCEGEDVPFLLPALKYIQDVHTQMRDNRSPKIRTKFLTTWDFYHRKYPSILNLLVKHNFSPKPLCPDYNWES